MAGLYAPSMPVLPTGANTGLSTWLNQGGAAAADTDAGYTLTIPNNGSGDAVRGRVKSALSTPYTIRALIALNCSGANFSAAGLGWYDGTKVQGLWLATSTGFKLVGYQFTTVTAFASGAFTNLICGTIPVWLQIRDDGTNIYKDISYDGENFKNVFSVAKASGFLGSGGYTNVGFLTYSSAGGDFSATLMAYEENP